MEKAVFVAEIVRKRSGQGSGAQISPDQDLRKRRRAVGGLMIITRLLVDRSSNSVSGLMQSLWGLNA